jgi:hypothetical protein
MVYLKEEQYYSGLYDLFTIKQCLRSSESAIKVPPQKMKGSRVKAMSLVIDLFTYYVKGDRYKNKSETVREWMTKDREKDEKIEHASMPRDVYCNFCSSKMITTGKDLYLDELKVMFWFECPACKKRKAIFENGKEYRPEPNRCPECTTELQETFERKGDVLTTHILCPSCNYKANEVMDFEKDRKEWAEKQRKDRELLEKYRFKFCMTDKEGQEYVLGVEQMKQLFDHLKENEAKQKDPAYKKVLKIKKLKVNDLRKKLDEVLAKEKYANLRFDKPQMDRFVIIPFTVEDANEKREEYDSRTACIRIIRKSLSNSNWKLMSEGVNYRLGYLSGRLKGYEREEDLVEMVRQRDKDKPLIETLDGPIY